MNHVGLVFPRFGDRLAEDARLEREGGRKGGREGGREVRDTREVPCHIPHHGSRGRRAVGREGGREGGRGAYPVCAAETLDGGDESPQVFSTPILKAFLHQDLAFLLVGRGGGGGREGGREGGRDEEAVGIA